jgi:hypothetical protein
MTYGVIVRVSAPIEAYDASHAEVMKAAGDSTGTGLISHVARQTADGFEITEIWESKEQADDFNRAVVWPAMQRVGVPEGGPEPEVIEFEPRVVMAVQVYAS